MANDIELRTKVSEQVFDDFIYLSRHLGFESRAECLRMLVEKELYGHIRRVKSRPKGFVREEPK